MELQPKNSCVRQLKGKKKKKKLFCVHIAGLNIRGIFFNEMYYYIIIDILFYYDIYIILMN